MSWVEKAEIFEDVVQLVVEAEATLMKNNTAKKAWVLSKASTLTNFDPDVISSIIDLIVTIAKNKDVRDVFVKGCKTRCISFK